MFATAAWIPKGKKPAFLKGEDAIRDLLNTDFDEWPDTYWLEWGADEDTSTVESEKKVREEHVFALRAALTHFYNAYTGETHDVAKLVIGPYDVWFAGGMSRGELLQFPPSEAFNNFLRLEAAGIFHAMGFFDPKPRIKGWRPPR